MRGEDPTHFTVASPTEWGSITFEDLHEQVRWLAISQFSKEQAGHTLQPTAVVHEAWMRFATQSGGSHDTEAEFRQWAGRIVRRVLVDHARTRHTAKRDVRRRTPLILDAPAAAGMGPEDMLMLSELLDQLARSQPRMAAVIEMRYFGGMKDADIALRLGVSDRTVRKDWAMPRAWLFGKMFAD